MAKAKPMWRTLIGFILSPAAPLLIAVPYGAIVGSVNEHLAFTLALILFYGYPLAVVFGIPMYFALRKLGWLGWWQISLAGIVIGEIIPLTLLLTFLLSKVDTDSHLLSDFMTLLGMGAAFGGVSGLIFWLVAKAKLSWP